jgi:GNAT superfamily N-acetyltransferase
VTTTRSRVVTTIRPYEDKDEPEVLELIVRAMGQGSLGGRTREFFAWKHLDNPFGRSFLLVAEHEGRIVGLRAFMRWTFQVEHGLIPAVRAVDTATHPDYQGQGIFSRLTLAALEELQHEAQFVYNTPNEKSRPGYLKMGWQVVGDLPVRVRLRRPIRFVNGIRRLGSGPNANARPIVDAPPAAELLADKEALTDLFHASGRSKLLTTAHTAESLMWRYGRAPQLDYRAVGDLRRGLAIFRVRARGSLWETTIAELLVPDRDSGAVRNVLRRVVQSARVDHLTCLMPPDKATRMTAARAGFLRSPMGMTLTARVLQDSPIDPLDLNSWSLALGDVEVF